jgi:hypothetical protein
MIEITEISDPIAEDVWTTDEDVSHRIIVGHPHPVVSQDENSDWYCPVMIEGFTSRIVPAMGIGPIDSLMNAMQLVRTFFEQHKDHFV